MNLSISEQLTYSTVRIECELNNGGISTGTGFFFNFLENKDDNSHIPVVITNKHVIKNAKKGKLIITKANEKGEPLDTEHFTLSFDNFESFWKLHPENDVDLCAMPIAPFINMAKERGDKFYTSQSCKHGHNGLRYTSTGQCVECNKLRDSLK